MTKRQHIARQPSLTTSRPACIVDAALKAGRDPLEAVREWQRLREELGAEEALVWVVGVGGEGK